MDGKKIQAHLPETVAYLKTLLDGKKINAEYMLEATSNLMELAREYPELSGPEKKHLVEETIKLYIKQTDDDDKDESDFLMRVFEKVVPVAIDLFFDIANGNRKFKRAKKLFKICC